MSRGVFQLRQLYMALDESADVHDCGPSSPSTSHLDEAAVDVDTRSSALRSKLLIKATPAESTQQVVSSRTGVVWDARMLLHKSEAGPHVERPERISRIIEYLRSQGLFDQVTMIPSKLATFDDLHRAHTKSYLRKLIRQYAPKVTEEQLQRFAESEFQDVFLNQHSLFAAVLAAGSSIAAVQAVVNTPLQSAFAIVRPPGHHAEAHCAMGFCVFNNVAVATMYALEELELERVLIVDWDVHHGNGTQRTFLQDSRVCYFSVHRYDHGRFFPGNDSAKWDFTGGDGKSINLCWEGKGYGDDDYLAAWEHLLLPISSAFNPQLIVVSAGFDAAEGDPIGQCGVTPRGYQALTRKLQSVANAGIVMVLEGGYHLDSLGECVHGCLEQLMQNADHCSLSGSESERLRKQLPRRTLDAINRTIMAQKPFWPKLEPITTQGEDS